MKTGTVRWLATALTLGVAAIGCGGDDDDDSTAGAAGAAGGEDPGEHACEHVSDPGTAITAGSEREAAPEISLSEEPYTITMPADATTGYVTLQGPAQALLFTQQVGEATGLYQGSDTDSILPQGSPNSFCPDEIAEHFHLDLEQPGAYTLELTSAADSVWLVLIGAEGHAHGG